MPGESERPIKISISSVPAHLPVVRAAVEQVCLLVGFDSHGANDAVLAVDEALANVIQHAYEGRDDGPIDVTLKALRQRSDQAGLEVVVTDRGRAVSPEEIRGRDLENVRPGGLGTHIMGSCMDCVQYSQRSGGGARLRMVKYLPGRDPADNLR